METKEKIVAKIKELGYNSRQISVKRTHAGYSSSLTVTVRDATINIEAIEEAVKYFEKIDRCPVTHEILSGGNTFISVAYTAEAAAQIAAPYIALVTEAMSKVSGNTGETILDNYAIFTDGRNAFHISHFSNDGAGSRISQNCISAQSLAFAIGKHKMANA